MFVKDFWPNFLRRPGVVRPVQKVWNFFFDDDSDRPADGKRIGDSKSNEEGRQGTTTSDSASVGRRVRDGASERDAESERDANEEHNTG